MSDTPNIILAGIPKTGTTALAVLLSQHSQISLTSPKEPHYYSWGMDNKTGLKHLARILGTDEYHQAIKQARQQAPLVIDASTSYTHPIIIKETLERLREHCPESKIILSVRNPVSRMLSDWRMRATEGWAPLSLKETVQQSLEALTDALAINHQDNIPMNIAQSDAWIGYRPPPHIKGSSTLLSNAFYDRLIQLYTDVYGDNVLVIPQETLRSEPETILTQCMQHIGVDHETLNNTKKDYNSSEYRSDTALSSFIRKLGVDEIARAVVPKSIFQIAKKTLTSPAPQPVMDLTPDDKESQLLQQLFQTMNPETEKLMQSKYAIKWSYAL